MKAFFLVSILSITMSVNSAEILNKEAINEAIRVIYLATENCDYETSTQYYFSGTKIYSYSDGKMETSDTWPEISNGVKNMVERCDIKYLSNEIVRAEVRFSENNEVASHISEFKRLSEIEGIRKYNSHVIETTKFGIVDGKLKILESHSNFLKFDRIN